MNKLDAWHTSKSSGEPPPYTLSFYDPSMPSTKPLAFAALVTADAEMAKPALNDTEKLRFVIAPEVIIDADSQLSVEVGKTISDAELAKDLTRRHNRSGRSLLRSEHQTCKTDLTDDAAAFIHESADVILRHGLEEISVAAYNRMASKYIRLCQSVPTHLARTEGIIADALSSSVKRLGSDVKLAIEVKMALASAGRNLYKTQTVLRHVLGEIQLGEAKQVLQDPAAAHALFAKGSPGRHDDPDKTGAGKRPRVEKWTPELGNCRNCGKSGHLNRDCPPAEPAIC